MTAKKASPAKASSKPASAPASKSAPAKASSPKLKKGLVVGETQIMIGGTVYASGSQVPEHLIDEEVRGYLVEGEVADGVTVEKDVLTSDEERLGKDENAGTPVPPATAPELDPETWLPYPPASETGWVKKDDEEVGSL